MIKKIGFLCFLLAFGCLSLCHAQNYKIKLKQLQKGAPGQIATVGNDSLGHWLTPNYVDTVFILSDSLVVHKNGAVTKTPLPNGSTTIILDTTITATGLQPTLTFNTNGRFITNVVVKNDDLNGTGWRTFNTIGNTTYLYYAYSPRGSIHYQFFGNGENAGNALVVLPPLSTPANVTATPLAVDQIKVQWKPVPNVINYQLEYSYNGTTFGLLANPPPTDSSYIHSGIKPATAVTYRLRGNADGVTFGNSDYSTAAAATTFTPPALTTPVITASALNAANILIQWPAVPHATNYDLESSPDGINFNTLAILDSTTLTYNDVVHADSLVYYRLMATTTNVYYNPSAYSLVKSVTTPSLIVLTAPALSITGTTTNTVSLQLSNVANTSGAQIEYTTDTTQGWEVLDSLPANVHNYTDGGLSNSTQLFYRAYYKGNGTIYANSGYSNVVSATTASLPILPAPFVTTTGATSNGFVINWTNIAHETGYLIQYSADSANWQLLREVGADVTTTTITGISPSTKIYVSVQGLGDGINYVDGYFGYASATTSGQTTSGTTLPTPSPVAVAASTSQLNVTWNNITNNSGYSLEISRDNAIWTIVATPATNATAASITGLNASTNYYIRLMAKGNGSTFTNSNYGVTSVTTGRIAVPTIHGAILNNAGGQASITGFGNLGLTHARSVYIMGGPLTYKQYTDAGLQTLVTYSDQHPGGSTGIPAVVSSDTMRTKSHLDSLLTEVGKRNIFGFVFWNEVNNFGYWNTSAQNMLNNIAACVGVAHQHGIQAGDGGLPGDALKYLVWEDYVNRGFLDSANDYKNRAFEVGTNPANWRSSSNYGPKIRFLDTILLGLKVIPVDFVNPHWYETERNADSNKTTVNVFALVQTAWYLNRKTGKPVVTNEFGLNNTGAIGIMQNLLDAVSTQLNMPWAFWFSYPVHPLTNDAGALTPFGSAYKAKVQSLSQ